MLIRDGEPFTTGECNYLDTGETNEQTAKIYVRLRTVDLTLTAQLDTGSAWSVLRRELVEDLGLISNGEPPGQVPLVTRFGTITGDLVRVPVTLLADKGESLDFEATVFVSPDWPGGNFIGYGGLLQHIRFAVDPELNLFYFGKQE